MTWAEAKTLCDILGVAPGSSREQFRDARRDLAAVWHPDKFGDDPAQQKLAEERLKTINAAYERLISEPVDPEPRVSAPVQPESEKPRPDPPSGPPHHGVPHPVAPPPSGVPKQEGRAWPRLFALAAVWMLIALGVPYLVLWSVGYRASGRVSSTSAAAPALRGRFKPIIKPAQILGLAFYRGAEKIGEYNPRSPDDAIEMPEGEYELELRGAALKAPVRVHVTVVASQTTSTITIDLAGRLND